jgi:phosphatidylglycerol lysyltransferase
MFTRIRPYLRHAVPFVSGGFFVLALVLMHHQLKHYHVSHIVRLVFSMPSGALLAALGVSVVGYGVLTVYDRLALAYLERDIPVATSMIASFVSFAVSHVAGHAMLSGSSMRYRFYAPLGFSGIDVLKLMLVNMVTYGLGLGTVFLGAYALLPAGAERSMMLPYEGWIAAGFGLAYLLYWLLAGWVKPSLHVKGVAFRLPSLRISLWQALTGTCDMVCAGLVLYLLLSVNLDLGLAEFFTLFVAAQVLGIVSQVPGGLGIFEGVFLNLLADQYAASDVLAALIVYRMVYYFLPLCVAGGLLLFYELRGFRHMALKTV